MKTQLLPHEPLLSVKTKKINRNPINNGIGEQYQSHYKFDTTIDTKVEQDRYKLIIFLFSNRMKSTLNG
jgi:hypothetical protein